MPSQRPSAAFDPIPPNLDLASLVEETSNFEYVARISCDMIDSQGIEALEKLVLLHVIIGGKPLVIEGFQHRLDEWTFTSQWLRDNFGKKFEQARDLAKGQNMALSTGHYLENMATLTDQWTPQNYKESNRQRIYLKDIDCPQIWHAKLKEQIPASVFYLNESTGEAGGPGSIEKPTPSDSGHAKGLGVARAGDLMSCLPPAMRAENMMCYIGHEGTYTPAHREMCASLGHNLMVETSRQGYEDGKPSKPGSSIWFMTETKDRHLVSEYWLSTLGHDIEVEAHFAQINAWKAAPFTTYIVEQKVGDFILIPPLAPHQVWNRGTRTMKAAWNRTTVETLEMALHEALPRARMVCRDEQYKNKAIVYFALQKYSDLLQRVETQKQTENDSQIQMDLGHSTKIRQLQKDFKRLFTLYTEILLSEMLAALAPAEKKFQYLPYDSNVTCSFCRCNIFNRFLTCITCVVPLEDSEEDTYDMCMECFAMGRSCRCLSHYKWVEQFPWEELVQKYEVWRHQIIGFGGGATERSPQSLQTERNNLAKKSLAQVCQEQLKGRPWADPEKPLPILSAREKRHPWEQNRVALEDEVDDDGTPKKSKSKKTRAEKIGKGMAIEHVSCYPEARWKVAACSKCDRSYSYGSLWRMFDLMPLNVMEDPEWECPRCLKICSCGLCRRTKGMKPYEPKGTVLGHDTSKVADPRSVESLVNFYHSNMNWIKRAGDDDPLENRRLSRRADEAARAKANDPALDDNYVDEDGDIQPSMEYPDNSIMSNPPIDPLIDPMLSMDQSHVLSNGHINGHDAESGYVESPHDTAARSRNLNSSSGSPMELGFSAPIQGLRKRPGYSQDPNTSGGGTITTQEPNPIYGSGINLRPLPGIAPTANMISADGHGEKFVSNGIAYEYPDPTASQTTPFPHGLPKPPPPDQPSAKQKRLGLRLLQSDMTEAPADDMSELPRMAQIQQTLEEAKRNDWYVGPQAAGGRKRSPLRLFISQEKLAAIDIAQKLQSSKSDAIVVDPEILQSDYPSVSQVGPTNGPIKKRKTREEQDDDFTTRKRKDRKSTTSTAAMPKDTRHKSTEYREASSESDVAMQEDPIAFAPINKPREPRQLPKYLARRSEGDQLPSELPMGPPRRKSLQPRKSPSLTKDTILHENLCPAPNKTSPMPREASPLPRQPSPRQSSSSLPQKASSPPEKASSSSRHDEDVIPKVSRGRGGPPKSATKRLSASLHEKLSSKVALAAQSSSKPGTDTPRLRGRPAKEHKEHTERVSAPLDETPSLTLAFTAESLEKSGSVTPCRRERPAAKPLKRVSFVPSETLSPINSFAAEALPEPNTDAHISIPKPKANLAPTDPVQDFAEDNRKAKMKAMQWADDESSEQSSSSEESLSSEAEPIPASRPNGKLMPTPKSIFSRPGMAGKKVKITAAKSAGVNGMPVLSAGAKVRRA